MAQSPLDKILLDSWKAVYSKMSKPIEEFRDFLNSNEKWKTQADPRNGHLLAHKVILQGSEEQLEAMIEAGLDVDTTVACKTPGAKSQVYSNPMDYTEYSLVEFSILYGKWNFVNKFLIAGASLPKSSPRDEFMPTIIDMVLQGQAWEVKLLLEQGNNPNEATCVINSRGYNTGGDKQIPITLLKYQVDERVEKGLLLVAYGARVPTLGDNIPDLQKRYESLQISLNGFDKLPVQHANRKQELLDGITRVKTELELAQNHPTEFDKVYLDLLGLSANPADGSLQDQAKKKLEMIEETRNPKSFDPKAKIEELKKLKEKLLGNKEKLANTPELQQDIDKFENGISQLKAKIDTIYILYQAFSEVSRSLEIVEDRLPSNIDLKIEEQEAHKKEIIEKTSASIADLFNNMKNKLQESIQTNPQDLASATQKALEDMDAINKKCAELLAESQDFIAGYDRVIESYTQLKDSFKNDAQYIENDIKRYKAEHKKLAEAIQEELAAFVNTTNSIQFTIEEFVSIFNVDTSSSMDIMVMDLTQKLIGYCNTHSE